MRKHLKIILTLFLITVMVLPLTACGPDEVAVTGVSLNKTAITIAMDETMQLTATVEPAGADQGVIWESSDPEIATVDENGLVKGISDAPGGVYISATSVADSTKFAECEVTVTLVQYTVRFLVDGTAISTQTIRLGANALIPVNDPVKSGFKFNGWFTAATGGTNITSVTNVRANTDYYAQFTETSEDILRSFLYEAEHINMYGIMGDGASGGESQRGMITSESRASGNRVISYLYTEVTLTFIVWSDIATTSRLYVNLGTENAEANYADGTSATETEVLIVKVNDVIVKYSGFMVPSNIDGEAVFIEKDMGIIDLKAGLNYITLSVAPYQVPGLVVDYIRFYTTAILQWHELEAVVDPSTPGYPNLPKTT